MVKIFGEFSKKLAKQAWSVWLEQGIRNNAGEKICMRISMCWDVAMDL